MNAWIAIIEALHGILATEDKGGIALTVDARPRVLEDGIITDDGRIVKHHRRTVGDGNLYRVVHYIERAG